MTGRELKVVSEVKAVMLVAVQAAGAAKGVVAMRGLTMAVAATVEV